MELRILEYFIAVAEEQSFTRAAARFHVAQSAVSQQILSLERELGERLFERTTRSVHLTPAGHALMYYARTAVGAAQNAKAEFAARSELLSGDLTVGTVEGAENTVLPQLLGAFHRRYPHVSVQVSGGVSDELLRRVAHGSLDAALIALPLRQLGPALRSRIMLQDELRAVIPAYSTQTGMSLASLAGSAVITYGPDSGLRAHLKAAFDAAGLRFEAACETNYAALQVALVAAGVGTAIVAGADHAVRSDPRVRSVPIVPPIPYSKALVWRADPAPRAPLRALLALPDAA